MGVSRVGDRRIATVARLAAGLRGADAVATATGVRMVADDGVDLGRLQPRRNIGIHLQGLEARHALAIALGARGLRAELRPGAGRAGDDVAVVTATAAPLVRRHYAISDVVRAAIAARPAQDDKALPEAQEYIDFMRSEIAPASWDSAGVRVEEYHGDIDVVQTAEVQAEIETTFRLLTRVFFTDDASSRSPVPPAVTIEMPSSGGF